MKRPWTICIRLVVASGVVWSANAQTAAIDAALQAASRGDCTTALPQLDRMLESSAAALAVWNAAAMCDSRTGRNDRAIERFVYVTKLQPGAWQAWNNLGAAYLAAGRPQDAEQAFRRAVRLSPRAASALTNLAAALLQLHRPVDAFAFLDRAQIAHPKDSTITRTWLDQAASLASEAASQMAAGNYTEARKLLLAVQRPLEVGASWHNLLGYTEFKLGHADPALEHLQKALAMEPENEDYLIDLAEFLAHHQAHERTVDLFEVAAKRIPNSPRVQFGRAVALILLNRRDEATVILESLVVPGAPMMEVAWRALGECYEDAGRMDDVIELGRRLQEIDPSSSFGWYFEGRGMLETARTGSDTLAPATEKLRKAVELGPTSTRSRFHLARALEIAGDLDAASAQLQEIVRLDPRHRSAHYVLGRLYQRQGKAELARAELAAHSKLKDSDRNAEFRRLLITLR